MAGGLFALLDDVAALARMAAASVDDVGAAAGRATAKAAGVVVDDTAVTPQYVHGVSADRELPMIRKITVGSLRNKLLIILPVALVLSQFLPGLLTPILMVGGSYLCFEGAEKVWGRLRGHDHHDHPVAEDGADAERTLVSSAIRTDLILSAEIMVIALNEVASEPFLSRLLILLVVAVVITVAVYGVVGIIVKLDDIGLALAQRSSTVPRKVGRALVVGTPRLLAVIAVVGIVAMLWVGGHIVLNGLHEVGWGWLYDQVHHLEAAVHHGVPGWLVNTALSAVFGLLLGLVLVALRTVAGPPVLTIVGKVRRGFFGNS